MGSRPTLWSLIADQPGPRPGRAGLGPRVKGPGRPRLKKPGPARDGPARGPTLVRLKVLKKTILERTKFFISNQILKMMRYINNLFLNNKIK
jgi:hypothetical protein